MSRHQIAVFSGFLMNWISDTANHEKVMNAVAFAIKEHNDEKDGAKNALSELRYEFGVASECFPFEHFSKEEFFKLCEFLESRRNDPVVKDIVFRIATLKDEYLRMQKYKLEGNNQFATTNLSNCEYWRRSEFSVKEFDLLKKLNPNGQASTLWEKLQPPVSDQDEGGFQFYVERARRLAGQVGAVTKTVFGAARAKALDLMAENSAASFSTFSLSSPNARDFLLSMGDRVGGWGVQKDGLLLGHTSLKTRIMHFVCEAFYRSQVGPDELFGEGVDDRGFLEVSDKALRFRKDGSFRSTSKAAAHADTGFALTGSQYDQREARILALYGDKTISPLTISDHAHQIYQSLLAIDAASKIEKLLVSKKEAAQSQQAQNQSVSAKSVSLVENTGQSVQSIELSAPPYRTNVNRFFSSEFSVQQDNRSGHNDDCNLGDNRSRSNFNQPADDDDDDDCDLDDNRASMANFNAQS